MRLVALAFLVGLAGCVSAPKNDTEAAIALLNSRDPDLREIGTIELGRKLDAMPQQQRREIIAYMISDPNLRATGVRYYYAEYGITPPRRGRY